MAISAVICVICVADWFRFTCRGVATVYYIWMLSLFYYYIICVIAWRALSLPMMHISILLLSVLNTFYTVCCTPYLPRFGACLLRHWNRYERYMTLSLPTLSFEISNPSTLFSTIWRHSWPQLCILNLSDAVCSREALYYISRKQRLMPWSSSPNSNNPNKQ